MAIEDLLTQVREADLLRFTTAGSVDDGKSTLIGRLLHDAKSIYEDHLASLHKDSIKAGRVEIDYALLTDGLKAEREQGITIDVAYRHFSTPKRRFIIADTPGHEQYTRNMVTGASTANLAIILIDAQNGVLTQSKRHGFIASLLGIPHLVVAVNKMDLVGYSQQVFDDITEEYREFCAKLQSRDITFIPMSALRGDNVVRRSENMPWYHGSSVLSHLESVHIAGDQNLIDFRFPVQLVLRPHGGFRGYCGTIASGVARISDEVFVLSSGRMSRISRVLVNGEDVEYAFPPQAVTICLEDEIDIARGDMLAHPANVPWVAHELEAILIWMHDEPLDPCKHYYIKHTTQTVRGRLSELRYRIDPNTLHREHVESLGLNDIGRVSMRLFKPIFCDEYQRNRQTGSFVVIDPQSNFTVGAGMIIDRSHRYDVVRPTADDTPADRHITRHLGLVASDDRARVLGQQPVTIWFTGLSGSGKSTIAYALEKRLMEEGHACFVLDGDNVRHGLNRDLGFSPDDRTENIRRVAEVSKLFNEAGLIMITSFISPYREDRRAAREVIGGDRFVEVFLDTPLEICEKRDPKGLYRKARAGEIEEFTGVSSPYEPPEAPELRVDAGDMSVEDSVEAIMALLTGRSLLG
ncbi:MAG: sulfate adenylyltransferase subunit CysN [Armatimonadetes bacterium]|nr:sulfate adenylyltransferase subunit CysN [Armatimonadota bacterium]